MEMATIEAVNERLDGLERENRRLRRVAVALLAGVLVLGAFAFLPRGRNGRTIEAERLVLRDKEGRLRGSFGVDKSGLPALKIFDHRGLEQIMLGVQSEDFAMLSFYDHGATRVLLDTSVEGATSLRLFDASQREKAALFLKPDSEAGLRIVNGDQVVNLGLGPDGRVTVLSTDAEGRQSDRLVPATTTEFGSDVSTAATTGGASSPLVQRRIVPTTETVRRPSPRVLAN